MYRALHSFGIAHLDECTAAGRSHGRKRHAAAGAAVTGELLAQLSAGPAQADERLGSATEDALDSVHARAADASVMRELDALFSPSSSRDR